MACCNYWLLVNDMLKCLLDNLHFEWQKSEPTMFFDENSCWRVECKRLLYSLALNMFSHSSSELLVEDTGFCWRYRNWKIAGADNLARNLCCSTRLSYFTIELLNFTTVISPFYLYVTTVRNVIFVVLTQIMTRKPK